MDVVNWEECEGFSSFAPVGDALDLKKEKKAQSHSSCVSIEDVGVEIWLINFPGTDEARHMNLSQTPKQDSTAWLLQRYKESSTKLSLCLNNTQGRKTSSSVCRYGSYLPKYLGIQFFLSFRHVSL